MFTYDDEFKHIAKYMDIYELLLANGPMHLDEIKKALIEAGVPETSARRNAADFGYSDSELIWSDDNDRKYINHDISKYFIYELADALNVVIYGEALMQEIEDKYKAEAKTLKERIKELSVENSTNLNHCNKHYKDLMRAQTKIADLEHELANAKLEVEPLSAELSQAREELEAMKASPARLFKGFIVALWNKAIHRERRAESDGQ